MAARQVSAVGPVGLRRRGRKPGIHRPVFIHFGTLRLKPTEYAEHAALAETLQHPPPGFSRRQWAVKLMLAGLTGVAVPVVQSAPVTDAADDAFFDV